MEEPEELPQQEYSSVTETQDLTENFQIFRLDTKRILDDIGHHLRGEVYSRDTETWEKIGSPLLNAIGQNRLMTHLSFIINPNVILSRLEPEQVNILCYSIDSALDRVLIKNQETWELGTLADVSILKECLMIFIEAALRRAERGFESKSIGKVMKTSEILRAQDKKGGLPMISGRRKEV